MDSQTFAAGADRPRTVLVNGRRISVVCTRAYRLGVRPANAGKRYPPEIYSALEIDALMAQMGRGPTGARNRAIVAVMCRSGLRVAEALALELKDVDLRAGTLQVLHGKGDRRRVVGIDAGTVALLEVWLERRRRLDVPSSRRRLFCVISQPTLGKEVNSAYVREMLKAAAVKAGVVKRVHPHGFRHTFAVELAREGVPMHVIRKALGHADLATTERYLDHLEPLEVVRMMRARITHPESLEVAAAG